MISKKILASSGILTIFLLLSGIQGSFAAAAALPTYLRPNQTINGYNLVWWNNITVRVYDNRILNVTCWTTIWFKPANQTNASIIAASLVNRGGNILNKPLDFTATDNKTVNATNALRALYPTMTNETINSITNVWDLVIAIIALQNNTLGYNITLPSIASVDHAALFNFTGRPYFRHALFASKSAFMLLALDYDIGNWTIDDWTNSTAIEYAIMAHLQVDIWFFWKILGTALTWLGLVSDWLSSSVAVASSAPASSGKIASTVVAPLSDLEQFASGWAQLVTSGIPGYDPVVMIAIAAISVGLVAFKVKKARRH